MNNLFGWSKTEVSVKYVTCFCQIFFLFRFWGIIDFRPSSLLSRQYISKSFHLGLGADTKQVAEALSYATNTKLMGLNP